MGAFSCYKAAFANGERAWADKPEDLGARLHAIRKLEDHWLKTMPDRVKLVEYEKLISNPQKVLNDVVAWLGLEACELCLTPNETEVALTSYGGVEALREAVEAGRVPAPCRQEVSWLEVV